jgi:hypothetical protein
MPPALDNLPLLINNTDDTLPLIPPSDITAERFNGLYTPGDTPAPDDINTNSPAENTTIHQLKSRLPLAPDRAEANPVSPSARLRSRLALTPDESQADSVSPSAPRRSLRSSNESSPLNPTSKK